MPIIESRISPNETSFRENCEGMLAQIAQLENLQQSMMAEGEKARPRFEAKGKLLPRDRLHALLDPGSPFFEICPFAGYQMEEDKDGSQAGGGIIGGIGYVEGRRVLVMVNNSAVKGGVISPTGLEKSLRLQKVSLENKLPLLFLAESGGANLNYAAEVFVEGARSFANQARLSAAGIPQITVVHGNATAGGAYQPGLSDYVIVIDQQSKMFLAGPPLLKAATGEVAGDEELGGGRLHAQDVGTAEFIAHNDEEAIQYARDLVAKVVEPSRGLPREFAEPQYAPDDIMGVIPASPRTPYDVRELLARLLDGSDFLEFKGAYDQGTICGYGSIMGTRCGLVGNNAPITYQGATKAAQFIQLCDQSRLPLVFLHNTTGFLVGTDSEQGGIIKHGSKMIQAVTNARVPKISMVVGGSYGAGNYAMCGRGFDPRFILSWPGSRTAVMGGAQAGKVMRIVAEAKSRKAGIPVDEDRLRAMERATQQKLDASSTALYGSARLWDDGVIDPRDTRTVLGFLLETVQEGDTKSPHVNTFGISRM